MSQNFFALARTEGRQYFGTMADRTPVFGKKGVSHVANHADVIPFIPEIIARLDMSQFNGRDLCVTVDLGELYGLSTCVETADEPVVYRRRKGRPGCSRFVAGREGTKVSTAVIRLFRNDLGLIALMTCYFGTEAPAEPNSPAGKKDLATWTAASDFWRTHALLLDSDVEDGELTADDFFGTAPQA